MAQTGSMDKTPGARPDHLAYAISLYPHHSLAIVTAADPRGDGRPRRLLGTVRLPVGNEDLVGRTTLDTTYVMAQAVVEALSALGGRSVALAPRHPRRGSQGRPVVLRGQEQLPFG